MYKMSTAAAAAAGAVDKNSNKYEELLEAVIKDDQTTIQALLRYNASETKKVAQLLWKILSGIDRRDPPYHLGVTILRGVIEDWSKHDQGNRLRSTYNYEKLFRSIVSLSNDSWKIMNACECPAVRTSVNYWHTRSLAIFAEIGMQLSACKNDGENLLHLVSFNKREPKNKLQVKRLIECLIRNGCDIDAMSKNWTPLHSAISYRRDLVVEVLIELHANVDANNESDWPYTPLVLAILSESEVSAKILISAGANVNSSTKSGRSPLYFASERGYGTLVDLLMKHGANVNFSRNGPKSSALHVAAFEGHVNIVQTLINAGADVDVRDEDGRTPLHFACQSVSKCPKKLMDHASIIQLLIKSKADVNAVDKNGNSPLHAAANSGSSQIICKLLKFKVVHFQTNVDGMTPLHIALRKRWSGITKTDVVDCYNSKYYKNVIESLIKAGAAQRKSAKKVGEKIARYFGSLLYHACKVGDGWSVELLMDYGANVNVVEQRTRFTALHAAIKNNQVNVIGKLIDGGAKVNAKDIYGETPLHMATLCPIHYRIQIVPILLTANARMDLQDNQGVLPLDIVINNDDAECLKLLLEVDGDIDISTCYRIWQMPSMQYFSDSKVSWILEHLVKLFVVNSTSIARDQCLTFKSNKNLSNYYYCYSGEVDDLKKHLVGETVSLYDFLNMNTRKRSVYTKNVDLNCCAKKFPQYYDIIKYRCHQAIERKLLMESAKLALYKLANCYLPDICVEYILDFLRNIHLKTMIQGAS